MFGRKKKPAECLPWYRARDYKGDLTENEKRQLDLFRMRKEHRLQATTPFQER
jgi:hypothetical protein